MSSANQPSKESVAILDKLVLSEKANLFTAEATILKNGSTPIKPTIIENTEKEYAAIPIEIEQKELNMFPRSLKSVLGNKVEKVIVSHKLTGAPCLVLTQEAIGPLTQTVLRTM
jgi:HSP90 family molecular chaperone